MPIADVDERENLNEVVEKAWSAFRRAGALPACVNLAVPILFFGDLHAYRASETRVLTVGKNPSLKEFPKNSPFRRFPLAKNTTADEPDVYLDALSAYFYTDSCPYHDWFNAYEPFLNGMEASYYGGKPSTALHTDICSPVATDPTWRDLHQDVQKALEHDGVPLWHDLLDVLKPHVVVISVAEDHLEQVQFRALSGWVDVHAFERKKDGSRRKRPFKVKARWHEVNGEPSLFIFGEAAQTPLGSITDRQKQEAGVIARGLLLSGS